MDFFKKNFSLVLVASGNWLELLEKSQIDGKVVSALKVDAQGG